MGLNFEFATASKIVFGCNKALMIPRLLNKIEENILLVTGRSEERRVG